MTRENRLTAGLNGGLPKGAKRALGPGRARRECVPEENAPDCKYRKVQVPADVDVDAFIRSLETRNASKRASEPVEKRAQAAAASDPTGAAVPPVNGAPGARMSDADLEEIARVLKSSRSVASARKWGLRLLVETVRARQEEERLTGKV